MIENLFAIDVGNTRVKWGLGGTAGWLRTGAIATHGGEPWERTLDATGATQIIVSNVAGGDVAKRIKAAFANCATTHERIHFVTSLAQQCGVRNGYREPARLGSDRWAALIAAHALRDPQDSSPRLVVMAGTATTIDALSASGEFFGGLIVPGLALMHQALHAKTAQLGVPAGVIETFPTGTAEAIASGAIAASVGAVARMREALRARAGADPVCILSGGAAAPIVPHLPFATVIRDNLVLDGLAVIAGDLFSR